MKSLLFILGLMLSAQLAIGAEDKTSGRLLELMHSTNSIERQQSVRVLKAQRDGVIRDLIATLDGEFPSEVKLDVARALGNYRAAEAVGVLVNNLALEDQPHLMTIGLVSDEEFASTLRPVSSALEKIGSPAIPALLEHLASVGDAKLMAKCLSILSAIDGHDIAKMRLQAAYQAEQNAERKVRLQGALRQLEEDNAAKLQSALRQKEADKK